jgi:hypothetical protein
MRTPIVLWTAPTMALSTAVGLACWWFFRPAQLQLRKETLLAVLDIYKNAWEQQDAELVLTVFTAS